MPTRAPSALITCCLLALVFGSGTLGCGGGDDKPAKGPGKEAPADKSADKGTPKDKSAANNADKDKSDPEKPKDSDPMPTEPMLAVEKSDFGKLSEANENAPVTRYTLTNTQGTRIDVIDYGAIVTGVWVPDQDGEVANVTLHHADLAGWEKNPSYFGAAIGRYANRIDDGKFSIDGAEYQVTVNEEARGNMLHGGAKGFDKRMWSAKEIDTGEEVGVELTYTSADGEEGFPGEVTTTIKYLLDDANRFTMEYEAETTKATPINLTNHCYWNLAGAGNGTIEDHVLQLSCDAYLPVDENLIPTGELQTVEDRFPFDFREGKPIGAGIANNGDGFDHCFVVNGEKDDLRHVATLTDPASGRTMIIESTEPGVQFYTAEHLAGGEENNGYQTRAACCLECNHFPNSPNVDVEQFPSTTLEPGDKYTQKTVHTFGLVETAE